MRAYKSDLAKRMLEEGIGGAIFKYLEEVRNCANPEPIIFEGESYRPEYVPIRA